MTAIRSKTLALWRRCASRARAIDDRYGTLIGFVYGTTLTVLTVAVLVIAALVWDQSRLAARACERSREFGPYIAKDYRARDVLPPSIQRRYEASIPRRCGD